MKWKQVLAATLAFLGLRDIPQAEGKVSLSDDQKQKLNELQAGFAEAFIAKAQEDLDSTNAVNSAQQQLAALLAENGIDFNEGGEGLDDAGASDDAGAASASGNAGNANLTGQITALKNLITKLQGQNDILANLDAPGGLQLENPSKPSKMKHSASHLFASGHDYDSLERPWNRKALEVLQARERGQEIVMTGTDWTNAANIQRINDDFGAYWAVNRDEILDIISDYRSIPAHWEVISNVDDEVRYSAIINGEITQGRKRAWLPKNKQKFVPLKGQVNPVQIDMEWEGAVLQQLEKSWMNRLVKADGSQPYKMSFIYMLVEKLLKEANKEDQIALIKGVFVDQQEVTEPMPFLFRTKGLLQIVRENMNKTYKPFSLPKPTTSNIVDVVKAMCDGLPEERKNMPGLWLYMSKSWVRKYNEARKLLDGLMPTYDPNEMTVEGYPNVRIYGMDYLEGTDFFFITTEDNIMVLQNVRNEKNFIKFETLKRMIYAHADYKLGIHVDVFGTQWEDGVIPDYNSQIFWSNDVPLLTDVYVPQEANVFEPTLKWHNAIQVGNNTQATAITNLKNATPGTFVYIKGNTSDYTTTIANGGNFDLTGNITLTDGTLLVLYVKPDGKFVEVKREITTTAATLVELAPNATTANGADGVNFLTGTNTGATNLTDITNAVDGTVYTITGGGGTPNATTVNKAGKFSRIASNITLANDVFIKVMYVAATDNFIEVARG